MFEDGVQPTRELASRSTSGLLVGVEGRATTPAADEPGEVIPQRTPTRVAAVTKTKPTRRLKPGDLICGQCGEGNPPTRKFCSRCGEELTSAEVVKTRWYRKVFRRRPRVMEAGARPGQPGSKVPLSQRARGGWRLGMRAFGAFTMVTGLMVIFVPQVRAPVDSMLGSPIARVRAWWADKQDPYESVFPADWEANRRPEAGHPAKLAFDDDRLTYWSTVWRPRGRQFDTLLKVTFSEPVKDLVVFVYAGAPETAFTMYHGPSRIRFDYGDGRPNDTMELVRQQEVQKLFRLEHADGVTEFTIWIEDVHDQRGATNVAVSEFEFKQRK